MRIEDDGFFTVEVDNPAGKEQEPIPFTLDVYMAIEEFSRAARESNGDQKEYAMKLADVMREFGFPPMSHRANCRVADSFWERYRQLEKKDAATLAPDAEQGSPGTTD